MHAVGFELKDHSGLVKGSVSSKPHKNFRKKVKFIRYISVNENKMKLKQKLRLHGRWVVVSALVDGSIGVVDHGSDERDVSLVLSSLEAVLETVLSVF